MSRAILAAVLGATLAGCAGMPRLTPVMEFSSCAMQDEQLRLAFDRPADARAYMHDLHDRIEDGDPDAAWEAALLVKRIAKCLPRR